MSPFAFGWMGVILFFIISGFLIHYITLKKGVQKLDLWLFFNKRFWRIYPPYLVALLFFAFSKNSIINLIHNPHDFLSHLFLYQTFDTRYFFSINGVFWSLAVELHLYILYPLFLLICNKMGMKNAMYLLLAIHIMCTMYWYFSSNYMNIVLGNLVIRHWFTWALGAYLAECYFNRKPFLSKVPFAVMISGFLFFYLSKLFFFHYATDSFLSSMLIAIAVEKYLNLKVSTIKRYEKLLLPIGLCSYSFYLFHMPFLQQIYYGIDIFGLGQNHKFLFWMVNVFPVFIILFFISYASYIFIEQNSIKIGQHFFKKYLRK